MGQLRRVVRKKGVELRREGQLSQGARRVCDERTYDGQPEGLPPDPPQSNREGAGHLEELRTREPVDLEVGHGAGGEVA